MELRFDVIWRTNLGSENSDAGQIKCSPGPRLARRSAGPPPLV